MHSLAGCWVWESYSYLARSLLCYEISDEQLGSSSKKQHGATLPEGVSRKFHHQAMEKFVVTLISTCCYILIAETSRWLLWSMWAFAKQHVPTCTVQKNGQGEAPGGPLPWGLTAGPHGLCCYLWLSSNQLSVTVKTISSSLPWDNL